MQPAARSQTEELSAAGPTSKERDQLRNIREGLVDPEARPEDRRRWAEMLLSFDSEETKALIVELLGLAENPDVQRALCAGIIVRARQTPEHLDRDLQESLFELLGAEADDLRKMAAQALADFPGVDLPGRLGSLAAQANLPLTRRLAAIDALAPNTHRREVVGQLINLLDAGAPEITARVVTALESAAPQAFGLNRSRWQTWWEEQSRLSEEVWLAGQLRMYRDRSRRIADEFGTYREEARRRDEAVTARTRSFQRELFRALNGEQREAKLVEWLEDPLPIVKLTAFSIIKAWIADEGKRPEGDVLTTLLRLLKETSPSMRREVLEIVQNLNDPPVVAAILEQLEKEEDAATRHAIFKALGKLDNPAAIPALVREIAASESSPECVREAAVALGGAFAKPETRKGLKHAVAALKRRYQSASGDDSAMRAALLTAMAGVADASFIPEFLGGIDSDDATILRPAIRGVMAVGETSKLPRLRNLTADSRPLVRLAATEAVGKLGREEGDLESLLMRLNPIIETSQLVREAAWRGFRRFLNDRSISYRINATKRLRDLPDLEVKYLLELVDTLSAVNGSTADLETVLDRLASALADRGRYPEAVPHLRSLCEIRSAHVNGGAMECSLRLLVAMLRDTPGSAVADFIGRLATTAKSDTEKAKIVETVAAYLQSSDACGDAEEMGRLLAELRSVPADLLGGEWTRLLQEATTGLENSDNDSPPPPPGG